MKEFKRKLEEKEKELYRAKKKAEKFLKTSPEGWLRISKCKNTNQFYHVIDMSKPNGTYIKKKDIKLVQNLAQKAYTIQALDQIKRDKERIKASIELCNSKGVQGIYEELTEARKNLVKPYLQTNQQFIQSWYEHYSKKLSNTKLDTGIFTEHGEEVRSKSEKILADKLYMKNIPYVYEAPLYLKGYGTIRPDFTVLNVEKRETFYWEHFGMMDHEEYCIKAIKKIETLQKNKIFPGKNLILTYETNGHPLNIKCVEELIREFL